MGEKEVIPFTIQGPTPTHCCLEGSSVVKKIGSSIIDLHFTRPSQLGELVFTNFYSAFISIYIKRYEGTFIEGGEKDLQHAATTDDGSPEKSFPQNKEGGHNNGMEDGRRLRRIPSASSGGGNGKGKNVVIDLNERPWEYSTSKRLMPWPHFELGSQDIFSIPATESLVEWKNVLLMRLVIHQPSAVWKKFSIDDINIFRNITRKGFNLDTAARQNESRLSILIANTLRMLGSGFTVEPEQEKTTDNRN